MVSSVLALTLSLSLVGKALGATYTITKTTEGDAFFSDFDFIAETDPTGGLVDYVDLADAQSLGLAVVVDGNYQLRADNTTVLTNGAGRKSVRMESLAYYSEHVIIFNVNHMPDVCGSWPALWEYGDDWPNNGEVDIVEGVNGVTPNQMTLHTGPSCSIPASGEDMTGTIVSTDCYAEDDGNAGCGIHSASTNSFGSTFNSNGGGWFAMERTTDFIKVWFWPRGASNIPTGVENGSDEVITDNWGEPDAWFPSTDCDIDSEFGPNKIVINLTFCGSWAGLDSVYEASGCPSTCDDYVSNNPSAFTDAYFEIPYIKVYETS